MNLEEVTVVTCLYDIRSMENNNGKTRQIYEYLSHGKFLLDLPYNLIIFTEDKLRSCIMQGRSNHIDKTVVIVENFETTYFWRYKEAIMELRNKYIINDLNPEKDTTLYTILSYNKIYFLERSIIMNPFNSKKFIWIDFGISHVAHNPELIHTWIDKIPDEVKLMNNEAYNHAIAPIDYFKKIQHNHAGGIFSGSKSYLLNFIDIFKQKVEDMITEGWYQLEEAVITLIVRDYPNLFKMYYGDYKSIISNYNEYNISIHHIRQIIQHYIEFNNKITAYHVLLFVKDYIIKNEDIQLLYWFILTNYSSSKILDHDILSYFILTTNPTVIEMLLNNIQNIHMYNNTDTLIENLLNNSNKNYNVNENIKHIKIGVAIPSIKRDIPVLHRCLTSIQNQSRKPDIVTISLSGCNHEDINFLDLSIYDLDIKIKLSESLLNASTNRNIAASMLPENTDLICFFDSDDEMYKERIEYIEKSICYGDNKDSFVVHNFVEKKNPDQEVTRKDMKLSFFSNAIKINSYIKELMVNPEIKLINRSIAHGHISVLYKVWSQNKYDETLDIAEDTEYATRLINKNYSGCYIENQLSLYHNYRIYDFLYKIAVENRYNGNNNIAYEKAIEGLKYNIEKYEHLFYNELSIVSYYVGDINLGGFACDKVLLSPFSNYNDRMQSIQNSEFYMKTLPVLSKTRIELNLSEGFTGSSPSLIKIKDTYYCVVRTINYELIGIHYRINDPNNIIYSRNYIIPMSKDFEYNEYHEIINNIKGYKSHINGLEDLRLFYYNNTICFTGTCLEYNSSNIPQICYGEINDDYSVKTIKPLIYDSLKTEKNWLPFVKNDQIYIIYKWDPFTVLTYNPNTNELKTIIEKKISNYNIEFFRGSSPPIEYKSGYLCTIHYVSKNYPLKYYHKFIYIDNDFQSIKIGKSFCIEKPDIEYNLSICHSDKGLVFTSSYRDSTSVINIVEYDTVEEYLNNL